MTQNFYAQWRLRSGAVPLLRDDSDSPPEYLLQAVWQHQRLLRDQLCTLDGETVRVLHPGFLNREGGPDFRGAVVQFGDAEPVSGDVEVDLHSNGWRAHGHNRNPDFAKVILHVIWQSEGSGFGVPSRPLRDGLELARRLDSDRPAKGGIELPTAPRALTIRDKLDAPVGELSVWLNSESAEAWPESLRGQCCAPLRELSVEKVSALLRGAAQIRFRGKASRLQARARQVGWEQSLWEGLFRALGYKNNSWPMQCLAEQRERWWSPKLSSLTLQARLLGLSNLLPAELTRARSGADGYLRRVWDQWWREREEFAAWVLPRSLWRFHGQRPANHPQRRLALAAHWLTADDLVGRVERWCNAAIPDARLAGSLLGILQIERDEFWSWHWTIRSARLAKSQPLLGAGRVTDLAVNVVLPWLWMRAAEGKNSALADRIEQRYNAWPPAEDNSVLRLARERLLGGAAQGALGSAAEQQGLIQIVRDFCDHSNAVCAECRFPELVRSWPG